MPRLSPVVLFIVVFALSCNNAETPTSPLAGSPTALSFMVTTTSSHTIRKVKLAFDDRDVATAEESGGAGQMKLQATVNATAGSHTIRIVIVEQASSPNQYFASGAVSTPQRILDLAPVEGLLKTGEALEFRVSL